MLLLALRLASDLLDVPPPQALALRVVGDGRVRALASGLQASVLDTRPFAEQTGARRVFHLRVMERLRDRARYAGHVFFTPGPVEWAMLPLPDRLAWLYYVLRPTRIAGTYVRELLKKGRAVPSFGCASCARYADMSDGSLHDLQIQRLIGCQPTLDLPEMLDRIIEEVRTEVEQGPAVWRGIATGVDRVARRPRSALNCGAGRSGTRFGSRT